MLREARPGDAVLTIGAGSVGRALDQLAMLLPSSRISHLACGLKTNAAASLQELGVELRQGVPLAEKTSLGIGGTTDELLLRRFETIPEVMRLLEGENIRHRFLGGGTNVLIADGELPWVVLHLPQPARHAGGRQ